MEIGIQPTADAAARLAATVIAAELRAKPDLVLGLATGNTMESVYAELVRLHRRGELDFSRCRTFNLDEYAGLPASHPNSYRHYMNRHLFGQVNIDLRHTHLLDGAAADLDAECARYEQRIADCGGIDFQLLGIGLAGHLGFNEPGSSLRSRTRVTVLSSVTLAQNAPLFQEPDGVPRRALTMGVGTILECRRCLLLATGAEKADIVAKAIEGPVTRMISASALHFHPHCTVVLDEAAAGGLKAADHYRRVFENEPGKRLPGDGATLRPSSRGVLNKR